MGTKVSMKECLRTQQTKFYGLKTQQIKVYELESPQASLETKVTIKNKLITNL